MPINVSHPGRLGCRQAANIIVGVQSSITEQMDATTPHFEFLFNIFGPLALFERALIRERVIAGLAAAKRRGRIGSPTAIA